MAKRKNKKDGEKSTSVILSKPRLVWERAGEDFLKNPLYVPVIYIANIRFPFKARPFRGFHEHERDFIMANIQMALSDAIFGVPKYLANSQGKMAKNPDWIQLPFYRQMPNGDYGQFCWESETLPQMQASDDNNPIVI